VSEDLKLSVVLHEEDLVRV
jgi:hypothetical protein